MRVITAGILLLACAAFLWVLWDVAWSALSDLPERKEIQQASARATRTVTVAPEADVNSGASPRRQDDARSSAAQSAQGGSSNVRFIEKDGIVSVRVDGPLERAPAEVRVDPPAPPKDEPDLYRLVVIESAGVIDVRTHKVQLADVDAPATDAMCRNASGTRWPCGMRARTAMRRLIRRRAIECVDPEKAAQKQTADAGNGATRTDAPPAPPPKKGEVRPAICSVGNTNLSEWLLENGWATPSDGAPEEWRKLSAAAKAAGLGLYDRNGR